MAKSLTMARRDNGFQMVSSILLIHMTLFTSGMRMLVTATVGTTIKAMWTRMSTSSTLVKTKMTTTAVDIIEARRVCMNGDGFQEVEYIKKMIQDYLRIKNY